MKRDYNLYLKDILNAMESIQTFIKDMHFEEFKEDDKTSSAIMRKLEIIGEATKQIPDKISKNYPKVPWKEMAGMRDRLIHFYFGIDYQLIWETVTKRIPEVKPLIEKIIENE